MLEVRSLSNACLERRQSAVCDTCGARPFSVCASLNPEDMAVLDAIAEQLSLQADAVLVREGDPANSVFNITSGSVRLYKLLADGRRQIIGFLFAGDFIGLAAGDEYGFSAEAIEPTTACRFRKTDYQAAVRSRPALEAALLDRAMNELAAAQKQMLLLGRKTARERLASFLLDLPGRDPMRPLRDNRVRLPMTRAEMADYLGLTIETVSRELTKLKNAQVIQALSLHEIEVERPDRLQELADGEA